MQSYLKYKDYYDRKAKAAPLKEKDFCFILQPKADNHGSQFRLETTDGLALCHSKSPVERQLYSASSKY